MLVKEAVSGKQDGDAARRRGRGGEPVSGVIGEFPRDHDLPVLPLEAAAAESDGGRWGGASVSRCTAKKKARKKKERMKKDRRKKQEAPQRLFGSRGLRRV